MARRYGGKYSPDPDAKPGEAAERPMVTAAAPSAVGLKVNLLFVLPLLFFVKALIGPANGLIVGFVTGGMLVLAAWLTREGVKAQAEYEARKVARRPAFPRKLVAAGIFGAGLMLGSMVWVGGLLYPYLFGFLGAVLHLGAFGLDPMKAKGMAGVDQFQVDRVARAVGEGEAYLAAMKDAILRANDGGLEARVERFAATARGLFRRIEGDPGDLTAARKYLSVYLMGARDATVKFADLYAQGRDAKARTEYEALLGDLETNFAERSKALLGNDHNALDVEIQVLRDRLKLEA